MSEAVKPFGHSAVVECRRKGEFVTVPIRRVGSEATVRRAAELTTGFQRVISVEAYTRDQWYRVFGVPRRS